MSVADSDTMLEDALERAVRSQWGYSSDYLAVVRTLRARSDRLEAVKDRIQYFQKNNVEIPNTRNFLNYLLEILGPTNNIEINAEKPPTAEFTDEELEMIQHVLGSFVAEDIPRARDTATSILNKIAAL